MTAKGFGYLPLGEDMLADIVSLQLDRVTDRMRMQHGIELHFSTSLVRHVVAQCGTHETGVRRSIGFIEQNLLLEDAEADILHAALRSMESTERDKRSGSQLHAWLQRVLQRMAALGLIRHQDRLTFASLALQVSGEFESANELGETWLRVRSGAAELADEVKRWNSSQWAAVERFWRK